MKILLSSNTDWFIYNFRRSLAQFLKQKGHQIVLVTPPGDYAAALQNAGFQWIPWALGRKTLAPLTEIASLYKLFMIYTSEKPDLVHHHTIKPSIYGSVAAQWAEIDGIVNSITGRGYVFQGQRFKDRILREFVKRLYRYAFRPDNCIAIFENDTDRTYFAETGLIASDRTRLIESVGVDTTKFFPTPKSSGQLKVIMASRMLWDKGVGVFVDAARILGEKTDARFILVGSPDPGNPGSISEEMLNAWDQEGVVEWWGFREDMNEVYNLAHIITLPTMYAEGVPTVLLEAAACECPVVTTRMPGAQDFTQDGVTGLLVPPGDPVALADALQKLIKNPDLRGRMGAAGRRRVLEAYTSDQINTATLAVYEETLGQAV